MIPTTPIHPLLADLEFDALTDFVVVDRIVIHYLNLEHKPSTLYLWGVVHKEQIAYINNWVYARKHRFTKFNRNWNLTLNGTHSDNYSLSWILHPERLRSVQVYRTEFPRLTYKPSRVWEPGPLFSTDWRTTIETYIKPWINDYDALIFLLDKVNTT